MHFLESVQEGEGLNGFKREGKLIRGSDFEGIFSRPVMPGRETKKEAVFSPDRGKIHGTGVQNNTRSLFRADPFQMKRIKGVAA